MLEPINELYDTKCSHPRLPLKRQEKNASEMSSAVVVCCRQLSNITDELSIEANSVDPEQTASIGDELSIEANSVDPEQTAPIEQSELGPRFLPLRLLKHFSRREKQTTFVAIGALRVK